MMHPPGGDPMFLPPHVVLEAELLKDPGLTQPSVGMQTGYDHVDSKIAESWS